MKSLFLSGLLLFIILKLNSQTFIDVTDTYGILDSAGGVFGSGISVFDWNLDGYDDVVALNSNDQPRFWLNTQNGFSLTQMPGIEITGESKSINWIDFDNDGDYDISINADGSGMHLFQNDGSFVFEDVTNAAGIISDSTHIGYGHSWCDFDKDGDLDLHVAYYNTFVGVDVYNRLYRNDGNLNFTDVTIQAGLSTEMAPTFVSGWFDYNNDGWPDLMWMNDRDGWGNYLYKNNSDGTFTDVSVETRMNDSIDAMSVTIGDFDNDSWFDVYITNIPIYGNYLKKNTEGANFDEVAGYYSLQIFEWSWGSSWLDYNLDGWLDLFVVSQPYPSLSTQGREYLFKNIESNFEINSNSGITQLNGCTYSCAAADFNNDGRPDLITHGTYPEGTRVYLNNLTDGNYLKFRLEGVVSNHDAIGTHIKICSGTATQYRYTLAGDQYLTQSSQWQLVGLGEHQLVDSVRITWPSGLSEVYLQLQANQTYTFIEGQSQQPQIQIVQGAEVSCPGDSVTLSTGIFEAYLWNTGETTMSIQVSQPGSYQVEVLMNGSWVPSNSIELIFLPEAYTGFSWSPSLCTGADDGFISLELNPDASVSSLEWNTGAETASINGLQAGLYYVEIEFDGLCATELGFEIELLENPEINNLLTVNDPECESGILITAEISGGEAPYSYSWEAFNANEQLVQNSDQGDEFCVIAFDVISVRLNVSDQNSCAASEDVFITSLGEMVHMNSFSVYPVPSRGFMTIHASGLTSNIWVLNLISAEGRIVSKKEINGNLDDLRLDFTNQPEGLYTIRAVSAEGITLLKRILILH